mgnify:CR=1 FL=1
MLSSACSGHKGIPSIRPPGGGDATRLVRAAQLLPGCLTSWEYRKQWLSVVTAGAGVAARERPHFACPDNGALGGRGAEYNQQTTTDPRSPNGTVDLLTRVDPLILLDVKKKPATPDGARTARPTGGQLRTPRRACDLVSLLTPPLSYQDVQETPCPPSDSHLPLLPRLPHLATFDGPTPLHPMRVASLPVLFALVAPLFAASPESSSVVVVDSTPSTFTPHYAPENMPKVAASPRGAGSARLSMQGDVRASCVTTAGVFLTESHSIVRSTTTTISRFCARSG